MKKILVFMMLIVIVSGCSAKTALQDQENAIIERIESGEPYLYSYESEEMTIDAIYIDQETFLVTVEESLPYYMKTEFRERKTTSYQVYQGQLEMCFGADVGCVTTEADGSSGLIDDDLRLFDFIPDTDAYIKGSESKDKLTISGQALEVSEDEDSDWVIYQIVNGDDHKVGTQKIEYRKDQETVVIETTCQISDACVSSREVITFEVETYFS